MTTGDGCDGVNGDIGGISGNTMVRAPTRRMCRRRMRDGRGMDEGWKRDA